MAQRPTRSLKHEYELFVEQEIENYKESIPRSVLLGIGDDAVSSLATAPQFALTEIVLCDEVDRIIFKLNIGVFDRTTCSCARSLQRPTAEFSSRARLTRCRRSISRRTGATSRH